MTQWDIIIKLNHIPARELLCTWVTLDDILKVINVQIWTDESLFCLLENYIFATKHYAGNQAECQTSGDTQNKPKLSYKGKECDCFTG